MKKGKILYLGQFIFSKTERGLWYDHDKESYDKKGWGICLKLFGGYVIRPVPRFWERDWNPWKGCDPWFVIRFPCILPFISLVFWNWGFYLGGKVFDVTDSCRDRYWWFPYKENGQYLTFSATTRSTRWK